MLKKGLSMPIDSKMLDHQIAQFKVQIEERERVKSIFDQKYTVKRFANHLAVLGYDIKVIDEANTWLEEVFGGNDEVNP